MLARTVCIRPSTFIHFYPDMLPDFTGIDPVKWVECKATAPATECRCGAYRIVWDEKGSL